ncbi:F-box only protein 28 [Periplaneta americana]|uniref:F-box only protein 28 n=1 Tax=Periplaneta americana TaxID=6978 RepID=UPI0037E7263B
MLELLSLPDVVLEQILSYLSYDDIARYRIICRQFNILCKQLLNKGFILVEKHHAQCLKAVKSQLPRRESERRSHPLARHCDILTAIETRLSMLAMTFTKYIDAGLCCFIPGKVIDEIFRVLRSLKDSKTPPRAHEVLQELRDISSMAMEHFDEKIVPMLKITLVASSAHTSYSMTGSCLVATTPSPRILGQEKLRLEFSKIHSRTKRNKASVGCLKRTVNSLTLKLKRYGAQLTIQSSKIRQQEAKLAEQANKLTEQDTQIAELKRHLEEWDHKFGDLTAELSRAREESGAIAEGSGHDVDGRVPRKILPAERVHEIDNRVSRRKVTIRESVAGSTSKRTTTAVNIDTNEPKQGNKGDRSGKLKRRMVSPSAKVGTIKKRKGLSANRVVD